MRNWSDIRESLQQDLPAEFIMAKDPGKGIFGSWVKWTTVEAMANTIFHEEGWSVLSANISHIQVGGSFIFYCEVTCRFWGLLDNGQPWAKDVSDVGVGLAQEITDKSTGEIKPPKAQNVDTGVKASRSDGVKRCLKDLGKKLGLGMYNEDVDAIMERTGDWFLQQAQAQQDDKLDPHEVFALAGQYIVAGRKLLELWTTERNKQLVRNLATKNDAKGIACARFVKAADMIEEMGKFGIGETQDEQDLPASKDFGKDVLAPLQKTDSAAVAQTGESAAPSPVSPAKAQTPPDSKPEPAAVSPEPVKSEPVVQTEMVQIYDRKYKAADKIGDKVAWAWLYNHLTEFFDNSTEQLNSMRKHLFTPFTDTTWGKVAEYIDYKTKQKEDEAAKSAPAAVVVQPPTETVSTPAAVKWWSAQTPASALSHWIGMYSGTTVKLQQLLMEAGMINPETWTDKTHEQLDRMLLKLKAGQLQIHSDMSGPAWMVVVKSLGQTKKA